MFMFMHISVLCMHAVSIGDIYIEHTVTDIHTQGSINIMNISFYRFTVLCVCVRLSRKEKLLDFFVFDNLFKARLLASLCSFFWFALFAYTYPPLLPL